MLLVNDVTRHQRHWLASEFAMVRHHGYIIESVPFRNVHTHTCEVGRGDEVGLSRLGCNREEGNGVEWGIRSL